MSMTQTEFAFRVAEFVAGNLRDDEGVSYDIAQIYELVHRELTSAREFIERKLESNSDNLPLVTVVTGAYQMATGDGSLWPRLEKCAQDVSYFMYELVETLTTYHQVDLWEALPERNAAVEHWLVSGRENAVCDLCRVPLARGSGFLIRRGPTNITESAGRTIRADLGDELLCTRCFDRPEFRQGRLLRKPRSLAAWDWGGASGSNPASFILYHPPELTKTFFDHSATGPSLDALRKWIEDHRCPDKVPLSFRASRFFLRLSGRPPRYHSKELEHWTSWNRRLHQEADHAVQICKNNPSYACRLGRSVLLISSIITLPALKIEILMSLRLLFRSMGKSFELSEVLAQMVAAARSLLDSATESERAEREGLLLLLLSELTKLLSGSQRYEDALARAFEWLAAASSMRGRESAREPRYWVAVSLYHLGKYKLTKDALEINEANFFMWMEFGAESGEMNGETWKEASLYGRTLRATGEFGPAISILSRLLNNIPPSIERFDAALVFSELGFAFGDVGQHEEAAVSLRIAADLADKAGFNHFAENWRNLADCLHGSVAEVDLYAAKEPDDDFIASLRALEHNARRANNMIDLGNALANLALNLPPDEDMLFFEEAVRVAEREGSPSPIASMRIHVLFAGRLFTTKRFYQCRLVLDRAHGMLEQVLSTNLDSASRQELILTMFGLLDVRIELAALEGNWVEVNSFGEQFRARNLSRWMRIAGLADSLDPKCENFRGRMLRRAILEHRAADVEAEVRHLTRDAGGKELHELNQRRESAARDIRHEQQRQGRSTVELDEHFVPWDQIYHKFESLLEPDVGVLSFVSCRRRIVWTIASKDHATYQIMIGGARNIDDVDPSSAVPLFRNWPEAKRTQVSEMVQQQQGAAGGARDIILGSATRAAVPGALLVWESELELIAQAVRRRGVKRLFVVPHRELARLPFWGLVDRCGLNALSIVPSFEVAATCLSRSRSVEGDTLLIPDQTSTLEFAGAELTDTSSARLRHGVVRWVEDYTPFLEYSKAASVIHVAAHGHFNADNPYDSGFGIGPADVGRGYLDRFSPKHQFSPSPEPGADRMRLLTVALVMSEVQLNACRLVVLSACESGVPRIHGGGELTGLPNAFLLAGAKSVIASLWKVDDRATYLLMRYFYEEWAGGGGSEASPAAALAMARRRLQQTDRAAAETLLGTYALPDGADEYPFRHAGYADAFHCYGAW